MRARLTVVLALSLTLLAACGGSSEIDNKSQPFPAFSDDQEQFLLNNAATSSVSVTESGLQYEVLVDTQGINPSADSIVTVHYTGTLTNAVEFDSSHTRGEPATFQLAGTIPKWVEGVQLMTVGSTYRFVMPPELAYGNMGSGSTIALGDALVFCYRAARAELGMNKSRPSVKKHDHLSLCFDQFAFEEYKAAV